MKGKMLFLIAMIRILLVGLVLVCGVLITAQNKPAVPVLDQSAQLTVHYYNSENFISDASGKLEGLEYDILLAFQECLKEKGYSISLNFKKAESFSSLYETIRNGGSNDLGACSFSITKKRLTEVDFSPPYMPDIEVLISSNDIPISTDTNVFFENIKNATAFGRAGNHLRGRYFAIETILART